MPSDWIAKVKKTSINKLKYAYLLICIQLSVSFLYSDQDYYNQYMQRAFAYYEQSLEGISGFKYYTDVYDGQYLTEKTKIIRSILQIKETYELGVDENFYVVSSRWKSKDIVTPHISNIDSHQFRMFANQRYISLRDNFTRR